MPLKFHGVVGGFLQTRSKWHGPAEVEERIRESVSNGSLVNTRVKLFEWNENWEAVGERIAWLMERHGKTIKVNLYGYSWGAGYGIPRLCEYLRLNGIVVENVVLCDPVYRHWYWGGNWRAFANHPYLSWFTGPQVIWIPDNVRNVKWFKQEMDFPRAHIVQAVDPKSTVIQRPVMVFVKHTKMDDHPSWHDACVQAAMAL